ncbi:MAG: AI-2E family transporter [Polyangiaceae bacterium]|nr:AI-2E family transporter [Polyangiaceae bacterium]
MSTSTPSPDDGRDTDRLDGRSPVGRRVLAWTAIALTAGALLVFVPFWAPLLLAAWVAAITRPLLDRLARVFRGRRRAAGALTAFLVVAALVPVTAVAIALATEAVNLVERVAASEDALAALRSVVSGDDGARSFDLGQLVALVEQHGERAWMVLKSMAGAAASVAVGLFVFVLGVYTVLVDGPAFYAWAVDHGPLARKHAERLAAAFTETGRGLFIGIGLTALAQGILATIGYVVLGIPQALVLGALTVLAALIPTVGTGLVWVPVAVALALDGRTGAAIAMGVIGLVVSTVDNFLRPALSRYGKLKLPSFVLLLAMLGGLAAFGPWGVVLGPLVVRLAVEILEIAREERAG